MFSFISQYSYSYLLRSFLCIYFSLYRYLYISISVLCLSLPYLSLVPFGGSIRYCSVGGGNLTFLGACLTFTSWYITSVAFTVLSPCSHVLSFLTSFTILGDFSHVTSFRFSFPFSYMLIVVALRNPAHLPSPQLLYSSPSPLALSHLLPAYCYSALAAGSRFFLFSYYSLLPLILLSSCAHSSSFRLIL